MTIRYSYKMITFRQLRYFESLSRHLNFSRAAADCAVSQPALSLQIQELERNLGVDLVERSKAAIGLTEAGREIAARATRILADIGDLEDFSRQSGRLLTGPLRLGVIPSVGPYLLPGLLPVLKHQFPALELQVRESQTANLMAALLDRKIDLALLALPVMGHGITQLALFEDPFYLLTPRGHPLASGAPVQANDLRNERVLLLEEGHCLRDQALNFCARAGATKAPEFGATSLATIVQLAGNGYGITILPEMAVPVEARNRPGVAVAPFAEPRPARTIGLVWRETSRRSGDYHELGRIIREQHASSG